MSGCRFLHSFSGFPTIIMGGLGRVLGIYWKTGIHTGFLKG